LAGQSGPAKEQDMKTNVGGIDKVLRIVVGIGLLSLIFIVDGPAKWWGLVGLVPLGTVLFGSCPLYALFGLSTCPLENKSA
jgi:Inner membrane protein YgaP-like, transmembrane domain